MMAIQNINTIDRQFRHPAYRPRYNKTMSNVVIVMSLLICAHTKVALAYRREILYVTHPQDASQHIIAVYVPTPRPGALLQRLFQPSTTPEGSRKLPVVLALHGFCLPTELQELITMVDQDTYREGESTFTTHAGWADLVDGGRRRWPNPLGSLFRRLVDIVTNTTTPVEEEEEPQEPFLYVMPPAPTVTRVCALCVSPDRAANTTGGSALRATTSSAFVNAMDLMPDDGTGCPAWDATDACCRVDDQARADYN
jgi:hypothetical protein